MATRTPALPDDQPISGHLLPREAYFSPEWFEREQEELFGRCWQFAGMTDDFSEPGSYKAVQVGPHPLLVVRGADGELRAMHNLCRHRGTQVLSGSGCVKRAIVCPYHRWTYDIDGRLRHVPQANEFPGGIDKASLSLAPARLETFREMVFVHPNPEAEPLSDWLGDFPTYHGPFEPGRLMEIFVGSYPVHANWKTVLENHLDGYHLEYVHQETLKGYDHRRQQHYLYRRHWSLYDPVQAGKEPPDKVSTRMPVIDHVDEHWHGSSVHMLFPNLAVSTGATFWSTVHVVPTGPESCRLDMRSRVQPLPEFVAKSIRRLRPVGKAARRIQAGATAIQKAVRTGERNPLSLIRLGLDVEMPLGLIEEDVFCCEALQTGLRSPNFKIGPLAPRYEKAILAFQQNVLDYLPISPRS